MSIKIFNQSGSITEYKKLSERLPEFLKKYSPDDGYKIIITAHEFLNERPAMLDLVKTAIANGQNPKDIGLSIGATSFVFEASLLKDDTIIANDRSLQMITTMKDYECGMTAARQRLVAAMGFGGEVFDDNEHETIKDLGGSLVSQDATDPVYSTPATATTTSPPKKKTRRKQRGSGGGMMAESSAVTAENSPSAVTEPAVTEPVVTEPVVKEHKKDVPEAILRQIAHQASLRGVETPPCTTIKEAKEALLMLLS